MLGEKLSAERVSLGSYYKPCIARLPDGELRLIAECTGPNPNLHLDNDHPILRSGDGGRTWTELAVPNLTAGEPYFTALKSGTLLMTGDVLVKNSDRNTLFFIHRSEDGGLTWVNPPGVAVAKTENICVGTRTILELSDGSLMFGFADRDNANPDRKGPKEYIWRSFDDGKSWEPSYSAHFEGVPEGFPYAMFEEARLWQARSGKIYGLLRVPPKFSPLPDRPEPLIPPGINYPDMRDDYRPGQPPYTKPDGLYLDDFDRIVVYCTTDLGRTWKKTGDLGDCGEFHYPSILRLKDGRLLLTHTVRAGKDQLGVRAVLGEEFLDGFRFDLENDLIMIETKTPMNQVSGGGFGPSVQLDDGTLVTAYSYRVGKTNADLYTAVVRWKIS